MILQLHPVRDRTVQHPTPTSRLTSQLLAPLKMLLTGLIHSMDTNPFLSKFIRGKGLQVIAIQASPQEQAFAGFWMMRDISTL